MSRESKIQAIASGLQPDALDLTQFAPAKRGNTAGYRQNIKVSSQDAAGALAFSALEVVVDGEKQSGDPLPSLLLRLKYAEHRNRDNMRQALEIIVHRYGGLATKHADTMRAVCFVALAEWVGDQCPACRQIETDASVSACECVGRVEKRKARSHVDDPWEMRDVIVPTPIPGCAKCKGLGRIFAKAKRGNGMWCVACRNSGRTSLDPKRRHRWVNDQIRASGKGTAMLSLQNFRSHWMKSYCRILDNLRAIDKAQIVTGIDLGMEAGFRAEEAPEKEEA